MIILKKKNIILVIFSLIATSISCAQTINDEEAFLLSIVNNVATPVIILSDGTHAPAGTRIVLQEDTTAGGQPVPPRPGHVIYSESPSPLPPGAMPGNEPIGRDEWIF